MAATSTPKISSVFSQVKADNPELVFELGDDFQWSPTTRTITHPPIDSLGDLYQLLHETGHAQLGHSGYTRDIELLDMERQAWHQAINHLAPKYQLDLTDDDDAVQDSLDSYRQWLYDRSTCPNCSAVGHETSSANYSCLVCQQSWRVNEARTCQLRRYKTKNRP